MAMDNRIVGRRPYDHIANNVRIQIYQPRQIIIVCHILAVHGVYKEVKESLQVLTVKGKMHLCQYSSAL